MANTPFDDLGTEEILSTRISGIQDAVKNIEQSLNMDTEAVSEESLTLLADAMGRYRIAEAVGKRNWLDDPAPVIEQYNGGSWTQISTGFTIDYAGGAVIFADDKVGEQFRASFTRVKNTSGHNSHLSDYPNHGNLKNKLINGSMGINQRGFNGVWSGLSDGDYGYDRWKRYDASNIAQIIEAGNFKPSTKHTLSGTNVTTAQITSPASGNWTIVVPNNAINIQLEEGEYATPFEQRPIGLELMLCQRYFWKGTLPGNAQGNYFVGGATDAMSAGVVSFSTPMRTTPTIAIVSPPTYENATHHDFIASPTGFVHRVDAVAAGTYRAYLGIYSADAEL